MSIWEKRKNKRKDLKIGRFILVASFRALLLLLIYSYIPLVGNVMAFQKFNPSKGFLGSKWVGLKNFRYVFDLPDIYQIIWKYVLYCNFKDYYGNRDPGHCGPSFE